MEQLAVELGEGVGYAVDHLAVAGLQRVAAATDAALIMAVGARRIVEYGPQSFRRIKITLEDAFAGLEPRAKIGGKPFQWVAEIGLRAVPMVRTMS
jgi:hypothetical protein